MNLTPHFTLDELTRSDTAKAKKIDNTPNDEILDNLYTLAGGLERIRSVLGGPIKVSSGYRSPKLNTAVGGSRTSSHTKGLAADFVCPAYGNAYDVARFLVSKKDFIAYDKLIYERTWVHVQFAPENVKPRLQEFTAHFGNGPATYTVGVA